MPIQPDVHLNLNVRGLGVSATLAINERSNALRQQGRQVYKLGLGQSPFPVPPSVVDALRQFAGEKDYLPVKGLPALQEAIASHLDREHDVAFRGEDIMIGPGSKELMFILQLVYYGDLVIPTPSWVSYANEIVDNRCRRNSRHGICEIPGFKKLRGRVNSRRSRG